MNLTDVADPNDPRRQRAERRGFLTRLLAVLVGGLVVLFPFAAGLGVLLDPLRRKSAAGHSGGQQDADLVRITTLDMLPSDGTPRLFPVTTDTSYAWTRAPAQHVGSVYLRREPESDPPRVIALSSVCPHLGCAVEFDDAQDQYECPCHKSGFALDGQRLFGPSLRGLDPLETKLVEEDGRTDIWIAYRKFRTGIMERIAIG